jgi:coenzyme F420-reducing hydrogenase delta subunit
MNIDFSSNSWVTVLSRFGLELSSYPEPPKKPISIALIDDGVNMGDAQFNGFQLNAGASYCLLGQDSFGPNPSSCWESARGHGTKMAQLIFAVFAEAEIHVLKLAGSDAGHPTAESAEQAVRWAIQHKVDIISASWAIPKTVENTNASKALGAAVSAAEEEDILIFCAASDLGPDAHEHNSMPAIFRDKVFCIGAATPAGVKDPKVGKQEVDYIVPGDHNVGTNERPLEINGSSIATALAAGLAGLILHWISVSSCHPCGALFRNAKKYENMKLILNQLAKTPERLISLKDIFDGFSEANARVDKKTFDDRLQTLCASVYSFDPLFLQYLLT